MAKKKKVVAGERPVIYPKVETVICYGDDAITADQMKEILGWQTESDDVKFGGDFLFADHEGNKVRLLNNPDNRPFDYPLALTWATEVLKRHWRENGETFTIGRTGKIISGQHRGVGLVLAAQMWAGKQSAHWQEYWDSEPVMPLIVVRGIEETDSVINTVDTGKPRSAADAIYRSQLFADVKPTDRKNLSRLTEYATKTLWARTGLKNDVFTPRRTHTDTFEYLDRHPSVVAAVKHIFEEDADGAITKTTSPAGGGYSAALLYLMGTSASDIDVYRAADLPMEKNLDLTHWDKACEFFVLLGAKADEVFPLIEHLRSLVNPETGDKPGIDEVLGTLVKGWNCFIAGGKMTTKALKLEHVYDDEFEVNRLVEFPSVGGIDLGAKVPKEQQEEEDDAGEGDEETQQADPVPEEEPAPAETPKGKKTKGKKTKATAGAASMTVDASTVTTLNGDPVA